MRYDPDMEKAMERDRRRRAKLVRDAAPDLLAEAVAAESYISDDSRSPRRRAAMLSSLRAAIARAKGEA